MGEDLTGDANEGGAVYQGVCQACNQVGSAGAAGGEYDTSLAGRAGVSLCCVYTTLFVTDEDMFQFFLVVVQRIIDGHDSAAGITEDDVDVFFQKSFQDGGRATELPGYRRGFFSCGGFGF